MWKLACVSRTDHDVIVEIYDSTGGQKQEHHSNTWNDKKRASEVESSYQQAVSDLLKEGYEPFSVIYEYSQIWFRMKVEE